MDAWATAPEGREAVAFEGFVASAVGLVGLLMALWALVMPALMWRTAGPR